MNDQEHSIVNANEAVAHMAYKTNEVCAIYPITPATPMAELVEEWSAKGQENIFGSTPLVYPMQSEAGVAGAMHGALQTGSLSTTFTASQGLLLMLPNMYKIAGELTPNVIHVATRTIATHALSVFGDHSDVMAVRSSGYAMLASSSVQEAMDFALIAQAATLASNIPMVHFFDGFRTSHEKQKVQHVPDDVIQKLMDTNRIQEFRDRALSPHAPVLRGTSQSSDTYFQSREAVNRYYQSCPLKVQEQMDRFMEFTGRGYQLFEYVGDPNAEQLIVAMASATETIAETVEFLNKIGHKLGLIRVRLFRPFSKKHLIAALPKSCKQLAVLDRTKESGAAGEPLFLDVSNAIMEAFQEQLLDHLPLIIGGRYGLASKEFSPSMVLAIFENLSAENPKKGFTIGISDDLTHLSLPISQQIDLLQNSFQALFYGNQEAAFDSGFENLIAALGQDFEIQAYTEFDYDKSTGKRIHNLRTSKHRIHAPYAIQQADFVGCTHLDFLLEDGMWNRVRPSGTVVVKSRLSAEELWEQLPKHIQETVRTKAIHCFVCPIGQDATVFGAMSQFLVHNTLAGFQKIDTSTNVKGKRKEKDAFDATFLGKLLAGKGNELLVGDFPADGTYPTDTAKLLPARTKEALPIWDMEACTQCGACSMACPQAAIRIKAYDDTLIPETPSWKSKKARWLDEPFHALNYTVQVDPEQCTACNHCVEACVVNALEMKDTTMNLAMEKERWAAFHAIPEMDRSVLDTTKIAQQQLQEPLFKYSRGEDGCGQAPYLKLLSQLFGDRMLVANATGASSIFGGALPTTPWAKNAKGEGPAWSNSLFEDNAEFGLGFQFSQIQKNKQAQRLLSKLEHHLSPGLAQAILEADQKTDAQVQNQKQRVGALKKELLGLQEPDAACLIGLAESLVRKSIWIVGGDGWAYDIGFGGLDHVLASGENTNILVLDNQMYSNTGGQQSKATPKGAITKFGFDGKTKQKKDLGKIAMTYGTVYVASIAIGADQEQALKAVLEAEAFNGPSLIIAYCHSPGHGIDMKSPSKHQKAAVASGHWPLYRFDPRRKAMDLPALQMDSGSPTMEIKQFLAMEKRFTKTMASGNNKLLEPIQQQPVPL